MDIQVFKERKALKVGLILPKIKYKHILPSYLKWTNFLVEHGHTVFLVQEGVEAEYVPDILILSTVFTFHSKKYSRIIEYCRKKFPHAEFLIGGIFATLMPEYFEREHGITPYQGLCSELDASDYDFRLFPEVTKATLYSSRGCVNKCGFCCVPKIEGPMSCDPSIERKIRRMIEKKPDINGVVIFDNNFSCHDHFFNIVEELMRIGLPVDFSQGLDCETMTAEKMRALSRLRFCSQSVRGTNYIRFAFDKTTQRDGIERTLGWCKEYNIEANYFAYCLYNFHDSPEKLYAKIRMGHDIANSVGKPIFLFPQEYEPLDSLERHKHIDPGWTRESLRGFRVLTTYIRGFVPVGYESVFRWLGTDEKMFRQHITRIGEGAKPTKAVL